MDPYTIIVVMNQIVLTDDLVGINKRLIANDSVKNILF